MDSDLSSLEQSKFELPADGDDLNFNLLQLGCSDQVAVVPRYAANPGINTHISTLPCGLPPVLQDLQTRTENYLTCPEKLPIHNVEKVQRFIPRKTNPSSLYNVSSCPVQSTLQVERDPTTGELLGFKEVRLENTGSTAKNSLSLRRQPGPPSEAVRGSSTNYPFWPGGMDEPTLEAMEAKIEGEVEIDFENDLLTIPPGLKNGMTFEPKVEDVVISEEIKNTPINDHVAGSATLRTLKLTDIMLGDDDDDLILDDEEEDKGKETETQPNAKADKEPVKREDEPSATLHRSDSLEKLLPPKQDDVIQTKNVPTLKPTTHEVKEEWAENVNISTPVDDFHKRVPAPAHKWPFELDVFQKQAVLHLENHESVFVAAHTSAGKTVVAEYAIALSLRHLTRTVYTSPIKALSNQKFRDFRQTFTDVGLLTGDIQIKPEASCLIMTTEILRSMLYNGSDVIRDLEWVIFDEVHYINDSERGVVWEEVLIMLPEHVKIILLSATVPNTMQFAGWVGRIKCKKIFVISTLKRPVPLEHFLYTGNSNKTSNELFMIVDAKKQFSQRGYNKAVDAKKERETKATSGYGAKGPRGGGFKSDKPVYLSVVEMLRKKDQLPVVAFTFSKKRCDDNASSLGSLDLTTSSEKSEIHVFVKRSLDRLKEADRGLPQVLNMSELLKRGIAVHHSGILPILKEVVEMLFQRGLVKLLFATETFAMGVNMPARTVMFDSITKHDGTQRRTLLPGEYIQMAGRAGRRGLDTTGMVIILCKGDVPEMSELHKMMLGTPTVLESQFRLTYTMILNLLRVEELRVEDMMKRSFSESKTRKDAETHREKMRAASKKLREFKDLQCFMCLSDLETYYHTCKELQILKQELQRVIACHPTGVKYLSTGRVVVVHTPNHKNALGVILSSSTASKERTFKTLVICEQGSTSQNDVKSADDEKSSLHVQPVIKQKLFQPEGPSGQMVLDLKGTDIEAVSTHTIKVSADKIADDVKKRQIPRFRNDPPGQSTSIATQELLRLTEANPDGLEKIDPVKDLHLKDIDLVEKFQRLSSLESLMDQFDCLNCANFMDHFEYQCQKMKLKEDLEHYRYLLSERSLELLPEYHQRIQVLRELRHIDNNNAIQLKGRVACEINNHELVITELVFQNILSPLPSAEIAALLSCMVFQEKRCSEPELTEALKEGISRIKAEATRIGEIQREQGIDMPVEDFVEQFRFGLTQVVYEWARGMPFIEITQLTDVSEGSIVRTIQRLDETCRDVRNAARIIGDPTLFQKMEETSQLIKRDIVFAASLYTQ